jgi:hypothetical protein
VATIDGPFVQIYSDVYATRTDLYICYGPRHCIVLKDIDSLLAPKIAEITMPPY